MLRRWARIMYRWIYGRKGVRIDINGSRYRVSARVARGIPRHIDAPALRLWLEAVTGQTCVVDAGANIGVWSILAAARMAPGGQVLSVEPTPASFEILQDCARVNEAPARIVPVNAALSDAAGTAWLHIDDPTAATNRLTATHHGNAVEVPVVTLDMLCAEKGIRPGAIKVDVEGWELFVLNGARQTIRNERPLIVLELHWGGESRLEPRQILDLSRSLNYVIATGSNEVIREDHDLLRQNFVVMRPGSPSP